MAELLTKTGVVKAIQGRMALVVTRLEPVCESCKAKDVCISLGGGGANAEIRARNTVGAEPDDVVTISIRGSSLLKASFFVYMVPILALAGGILLGFLLSRLISVDENFLVGLFAGLGFLGAFVWLKKQGDKLFRKQEFIPEIISKKTPQKTIPRTDFTCSVG
ncbi:MAG: SoxR reducing system RseC family protein [Desulfobacterales bacterium]|nr:SoxR reducing system RseC family protein [Desulfobacterales bacterium]